MFFFLLLGFLPLPLAYYISPDFGQYNMGSSSSVPLPPPPPPYQAKYPHTKELYWKIVNQVNYYFRYDMSLSLQIIISIGFLTILYLTFFYFIKNKLKYQYN